VADDPASGPRRWSEDAFAALLEEARAGAAERERRRDLPHDLVRRLAAAGFSSARVPVEAGGEGAGLEQLFDRLVRLAAADSNVAHLFRGHLAFVEQQHLDVDVERRGQWYARVLQGDLVGNAQSEVSGTSDLSTTLTGGPDAPGGLRLDGRKYYTTGTLYADWIDLSAVSSAHGDRPVQLFVRTDAEGVEVVDDWAGFGQQLTGSGTTTFTHVAVDPADVRSDPEEAGRHAYLMGFFQLVLLGVVAGIGRAAVDDAVAFVRPRSRIFGHAGVSLPREDPLVQSVVGGLSATASAARAVVLQCARELDAALALHLRTRAPDGSSSPQALEALVAAQLEVYKAQQTVLPLVVGATSELFEVGGASSVDVGRALDRHWRNARTVATHNPAVQRRRAIGDHELNGNAPVFNPRPDAAGAPGGQHGGRAT
jgi:alkylation response protein AidB-like acyl-CoA dehydrogenase